MRPSVSKRSMFEPLEFKSSGNTIGDVILVCLICVVICPTLILLVSASYGSLDVSYAVEPDSFVSLSSADKIKSAFDVCRELPKPQGFVYVSGEPESVDKSSATVLERYRTKRSLAEVSAYFRVVMARSHSYNKFIGLYENGYSSVGIALLPGKDSNRVYVYEIRCRRFGTESISFGIYDI